MSQHLKKEEIIKYEFKLLSGKDLQRAEDHLEQCSDCRERLARVRGKFTALEALREDAKASEELIGKTLAQVRQKQPTKRIYFNRLARLRAAAAVIVIAGGLAATIWWINPVSQRKGEIEIAQEPKREEVAKGPGQIKGGRGQLADADRGRGVPVDTVDESEEIAMPKAIAAASKPGEEFIPDEPPFAPASNIELTVLPRRESTQLTIYNSADLTLVRDKRNLTMKKGWNWLQFSWEGTLIDPTSLNLEPKEHGDKITVEQLVFPPRLKQLGRWLIKSEVSGQAPFEITYFTSGINWRAFYMGTLSQDETRMTLQGYVRVANKSGEDYENAQTRLIVGKIHLLDKIALLAQREYPYERPITAWGTGGPMGGMGGMGMMIRDKDAITDSFYDGLKAHWKFDEGEPKGIIKEGLSEYFLYTIEGTETIPNEWGKRLPSFEVEEVPVESLYKYDEERWGRQAIRFVKFANDEEHELGQTPIPDGNIKIYGLIDQEQHLKYVGGTDIKYIPVNEEVELNLGPARQVMVAPVLMDLQTENYEYDVDKDEIIGWEEIYTWRIKVTNTRTLPVEVEITRYFPTTYWKLDIIEGQVAGKKHDAWHERFELKVEPRSEQVFTYKVRTYYGTRERVY